MNTLEFKQLRVLLEKNKRKRKKAYVASGAFFIGGYYYRGLK